MGPLELNSDLMTIYFKLSFESSSSLKFFPFFEKKKKTNETYSLKGMEVKMKDGKSFVDLRNLIRSSSPENYFL